METRVPGIRMCTCTHSPGELQRSPCTNHAHAKMTVCLRCFNGDCGGPATSEQRQASANDFRTNLAKGLDELEAQWNG